MLGRRDLFESVSELVQSFEGCDQWLWAPALEELASGAHNLEQKAVRFQRQLPTTFAFVLALFLKPCHQCL